MKETTWIVKELESLKKFLRPKIEWTLIMLGMLGIGYLVVDFLIKVFSSSSSSSKSGSSKSFRGYLYPNPPEKCYCHNCGSEIDMREYGLYGKHCREVERCPICGAGGYPLWRKPQK